jgi:hypothetical protein
VIDRKDERVLDFLDYAELIHSALGDLHTELERIANILDAIGSALVKEWGKPDADE